jgi:hypothetical protein
VLDFKSLIGLYSIQDVTLGRPYSLDALHG